MLTLEMLPGKQEVAVVRVEGTLLGGPETREIHSTVRDLIHDGHRRILLDLAGVPWGNSLAVGTLVASYVTAKREGARIEICCLSSRLEMVLRTELVVPTLFDPFVSEEDAVAGFTRDDDHPTPGDRS